MSGTFQGLRNKANGLVALDSNSNLTANNLVSGLNTIVTAGSTTTLTIASASIQVFTGTTTQTLVLPNATTLVNGTQYTIINQSTGIITINASGGGLLTRLPASSLTQLTLTANVTVSGTWNSSENLALALASANILVGNSLGVATAVAVSGDATISNTGVVTIANNAISNAKLAQATANTWKGNNTGSTANEADNAAGSITETGSSIFTISGTNAVLNNATIKANLNSANIYVGNGSNVPVGVAMSGDASLSNTGLITVSNTTNIKNGVAGAVPYQLAIGATGFSSAGTSGQVLTSAGTSAPIWTNATSTPTANAVAKWDANGNLSADSLIGGFTTTVTTAGITTLAVSSNQNQVFTGTTSQTLVLPNATTLVNGMQYTIINQSTGIITVNDNSGSLITTLIAGSSMIIQLISNLTVAGTWYSSILRQTLIAYSATAGTISNTDNILSAFNKIGGALNTTFWQNGKIYAISGAPNTDTTSSGSNILYFGPSYSGNIITLYNTTISQWVTQTFSEVSITMTQTAGNYDVYITSASSTTVSISLVAWSNDTTPPTRATQNGILVRNGASGSLLVGVVRTNGTNTFSWLGSRWIINVYNQTTLQLLARNTSAVSYTYTTTVNNLIRASNANTTDGTGRFSAIFDVFSTSSISLNNYQVIVTSTGTNAVCYVLGIGVDSTTSNIAYASISRATTNSGTLGTTISVTANSSALVGYHFFQRTESSTSTANTWTLSLANATFGQGGLMQGYIMG